MRTRTSTFQRAYEAKIIFTVSCAPGNGFTLSILHGFSWLYWYDLKEFKQVEYWLKAFAKINLGITI